MWNTGTRKRDFRARGGIEMPHIDPPEDVVRAEGGFAFAPPSLELTYGRTSELTSDWTSARPGKSLHRQ
jgi:hypothetical protein